MDKIPLFPMSSGSHPVKREPMIRLSHISYNIARLTREITFGLIAIHNQGKIRPWRSPLTHHRPDCRRRDAGIVPAEYHKP